jgi:hypothetical protein
MSAARCALVLVLLLAGVLARAAAAQEAGEDVACTGQTISEIHVLAQPPYAGSEEGPWWKTPVRLANAIHITTEPSVVRRFLIVHEGEPCIERERAESERILRAQPFIAQAHIATESDGKGGVILEVETRDELTPVLNVRASGDSPFLNGVKLGDGNILGGGMYLAGEWRAGRLRDGYSAHLIDYQFLGRPYMLELFGQRGDAGTGSWSVEASHRFLTDLQRVAWRVNAGHRRDMFGFLRGSFDPVNVLIDRQYYDIGGVVRVGMPGRLSLFGISFSGERDEAGLPPLPDSGVNYGALLPQFGRRKNARVNAIWGVRNVYYRPVQHFDALTAEQDMRVGFQLGMLLGRSLPVLGSEDDDILVATDMYAGFGTEQSFAVLEARAEGRQNYDANEWDGIIGSAHLTVYNRIHQNHTLVASMDWGGGWKSRVPLQLRLGDPDVGVRGYTRSRAAGARRVVARLEDRWFLGGWRDQADVGLALFADAGRVWAGDAPFGVNTPTKFGAGVSLLAAVPAGSKRTWRLDLAFPLSPDGRARWEVRVSVLDVNRIFRRESRDVRRSREIAVPSSVYEWP